MESYSFWYISTNLSYAIYFSEYTQASENAAIAESYVSRVIATPLVPLYYFYNALARLATYPGSSTQAQEEILKKRCGYTGENEAMGTLCVYELSA